MMIRVHLQIVLVILCFSSTQAQNLIVNGDLEIMNCPVGLSCLDSASGWSNPAIFPGPGGSPDLFNACAGSSNFVNVPDNFAGFQLARSGVGYGGVFVYYPDFPNYREFAQVELTSPLSAGDCYEVEFFVSPGDLMAFAAADIGLALSSTRISGVTNNLPLPLTPVLTNTAGVINDTSGWTRVHGTITSGGGEAFAIIGNFEYDAQIDTSVLDPNSTMNGAYFFIEDVSIRPCPVGLNELSDNFPQIGPNPFEDVVYFRQVKQPVYWELFDAFGRIVERATIEKDQKLELSGLPAGSYWYRCTEERGAFTTGKLIRQ